MKKLNKKMLALALTTAFVMPVVGPAVVPAGGVIVAYASEALDSSLKEYIDFSKKIEATPEYGRVFSTTKDWVNNARYRAEVALRNGNEDEKRDALNKLKAELNRREITKIIDKLGLSRPAGFTTYEEPQLEADLKQLITVAEYVEDLPEYERLYAETRDWVWNDKYKAEVAARNGNRLEKEEGFNDLKAVLNRKEVKPLVDKVGLPLPSSFTQYSVKSYTEELKDLITLGNQVEDMPEYDRIFRISKDWFENAHYYASHRVRLGDEIERKNALNWLRAELNRHQVKEVVDKLGVSLPSGFTDYTEETYDKQLRNLILIANYIEIDPSYKDLKRDDTRDFERVLYNVSHTSKYGNRLEKEEAYQSLLKEVNKNPVKTIYDKVKGKINANTSPSPTPAPSNNKQVDQAKIDQLKQSIKDHETMVNSALLILNNYPATIKGKEKQLVDILLRAQKLRERSAKVLANTTGEKIVVDPLKIPEKYRHLAN